MAAVTAVGCAGMALRFGPVAEAVPYLLVVPLGCLLAAIDLACLRLPETLVWPAVAVAVVGFGVLALVSGDGWPLLAGVIGGLALASAYLLLALLPGGQLGLGDVTLALLLGLFLGRLGPAAVVLGGMVPFLINVPVALWALAVRREGRGADLPFGPAMLVGSYLVVVAAPELATFLTRG